MVAAIRSVDPDTPIILDGYFFADAKGLPFVEPVDDEKTLYAFHNIAPWPFAAFRINKERYSYPDKMPNIWDGLDYELGSENLGWEFWQAVERGEDPEKYKNRHDNPTWHVLQREFK